MSIFNLIYRANIVTSGPRSTSKACFVKKLSIAFLAPTSWLAALAPHSLRGLHVSIAYPAPISWQKRPCSQSHVKHVSVSTAMAFKASDRRHHAVEFIRNPVSSYFHSQVFIFMRLSSLALPWIAIFARKWDCHAMVNSLAIARIAISTRNLRLSSLRLYVHFLKYLRNALSYGLETFWQFKWIKLKNKNLFFNRLRPPLVTIATFKVDACFWKAHFGSFHAKAYQNSMFFATPMQNGRTVVCCEKLG